MWLFGYKWFNTNGWIKGLDIEYTHTTGVFSYICVALRIEYFMFCSMDFLRIIKCLEVFVVVDQFLSRGNNISAVL